MHLRLPSDALRAALALTLLVGVFSPANGALRAQVMVPSSHGTLIEIPYRTYFAINPLGIPFDVFSAEIESAIAPGMTLGASGSYTNFNNDRYTSGDLKFRYYPGEVVLRGFALGGTLGYLHYSTPGAQSVPPPGSTPAPEVPRAKLDAPTLGIIVDYNWLLGTRRRFLVGGGIGAKRVLANREARSATGFDSAYLTARFVVGIAF